MFLVFEMGVSFLPQILQQITYEKRCRFLFLENAFVDLPIFQIFEQKNVNPPLFLINI